MSNSEEYAPLPAFNGRPEETREQTLKRLETASKLMRVKDWHRVNAFHHRMDMILNYPSAQHIESERISRAERSLPFEERRELARKRGECK